MSKGDMTIIAIALLASLFGAILAEGWATARIYEQIQMEAK